MLIIVPLLLLATFIFPYTPCTQLNWCAIRFGTGVACPGCGVVGSVALFMHGSFSESFRMQPMGPVVVVWLVLLWSQSLFALLAKKYGAGYINIHRRFSLFVRYFTFVFVAALIAIWMARLIWSSR